MICAFTAQFLSLVCSFASKSAMRWFATFICSSSTGTRWAKLLCARTSRVNSSSLVSVTAWLRLLAMSTPMRVTAPVISAARTVSIGLTPSIWTYSSGCRYAPSRSCGRDALHPSGSARCRPMSSLGQHFLQINLKKSKKISPTRLSVGIEPL